MVSIDMSKICNFSETPGSAGLIWGSWTVAASLEAWLPAHIADLESAKIEAGCFPVFQNE